jgi:hypothetical protein
MWEILIFLTQKRKLKGVFFSYKTPPAIAQLAERRTVEFKRQSNP